MLLAHGAGADMNAAALTTVADALATAKIPSLRFNFPYNAARAAVRPDRPPVLEAAVRDAIAELVEDVESAARTLVLGGRSMGGRICSMVAATDGALVSRCSAIRFIRPASPSSCVSSTFRS